MTNCLKHPHEVKARKEHVCQGCGATIKKGEVCTSSSYAGEGMAWTFYECAVCREHYSKNCVGCGDFGYCIGESYTVGTIKECKLARGIDV